MAANFGTSLLAVFCFVSTSEVYAQKQALIVGQTWTSNIDGIDRILTITAVNYAEGTFAGTYGMRNSVTDETRGIFDKDGGNLVGWALSYRNGYLYGNQVWSGHFVTITGTSKLAIKSLSLRSGPGNNPNYIISEYFVQSQEDYSNGNGTAMESLKSVASEALAQGQVWVNGQKDTITISKVNNENGTFAAEFSRARDKNSVYSIRGEIGKDGSTVGWSVIYAYDDPLKLNYRNSIAWCGHFDHTSQKQQISAMWLNTTEYKQLQNFIVTNVGFDKFVLKSNETQH